MDNAQKRGKGQQDVLIGALYRGAEAHISYKAGGNETAQICVADRGIATTSEKYTVAHSKHVGLKFFALKWQNCRSTMMTTGPPVMTLHTEASTDALRTKSLALKLHRNEHLICRSEFCSLYHEYSCQTGNRLIETWTSLRKKRLHGCLNLIYTPILSDLQVFLRFGFNLNFTSCHLLHNFRWMHVACFMTCR